MQDDAEHHHQRSLRGKFFVSFPHEAPPPTLKELSLQHSNVIKYTRDLIYNKYGVSVTENCFKTCHFTKKGLVFRLINLSPFSPYAELVTAIKNGTGKQIHSHYINFSLTPLRSSLLYDLRRYKKEKHIEKYYCDADGTLSFVLNEGDNKTRCTSTYKKVNNIFRIKTLTNEELKQLLLLDGDNGLLPQEDNGFLPQENNELLPEESLSSQEEDNELLPEESLSSQSQSRSSRSRGLSTGSQSSQSNQTTPPASTSMQEDETS